MNPTIISSDGSLSVSQADCTFDVTLPQASPSGFRLNTAPTPSFLFAGNGNTLPLLGYVRLSQQSGNVMILNPDGLYVGYPSFTETLLSVIDTPTINLTTSGIASHTLQADVKVSLSAANSLIVKPDGLYVSASAVGGTYTDAQARNAISVTLPLIYNSATGVLGINQASGTQAGYLSLANWNTFNAKEPAVPLGTTAQYYRGDKTWQLLNTTIIPEGTNQYFTGARARNVLSATAPIYYNPVTGVISTVIASGTQDGYLGSSDWSAFNAKITGGTSLASSSALSVYKDATSSNVLEFRGVRAGTGLLQSLSGDDIVLSVQAAPPVANAGADQSIFTPTTSVTMAGSASTPSGTITSTTWLFLSGPGSFAITDASRLTTTVTGLSTAGNYAFRLLVSNSYGLVATDDMIVVASGGSAPTDQIYIGVKSTNVTPTQSEILAAVASTQNGALNVNADWTSLSASAPVYCFFAIPDTSSAYEKNKWYVDPLNNGNIGGSSDLFGALTVVSVSSVNYSVGMTNYPTQFVGVASLQKV